MRLGGLLRQLLVWLHRIRKPDFVVRRVWVHPAPEEVKPGMIVIVGDRHLQKWACFQCPGGCGEVIKLSLNAKQRSCWRVVVDGLERPTVEPSVRQMNDCRCHFWIRGGNVQWCDD